MNEINMRDVGSYDFEDDPFDEVEFENSLLLNSNMRTRRKYSKSVLARACPAIFDERDDARSRAHFEVEAADSIAGSSMMLGMHPGAAKRNLGKAKVTDPLTAFSRGGSSKVFCSASSTAEMLWGSKLNILLLAMPFALVSRVSSWSPGIISALAACDSAACRATRLRH